MNLLSESYLRPLPKDLPGFELEKAVARMMNSAELWWMALEIFHAHYGGWEETWRQSQVAPNAERKCVHALRSSAGNIGAHRLAAAAGVLESALWATTSTPELLDPMRASLLECFNEVRQSATTALMVAASTPPIAP